MRRPDELENFKCRINLTEYAAACGYVLDRRSSSRNSAVMAQQGDKVIIAIDTDQHWIYFSVGDNDDNGSIIDFVQNRRGGSLGDVRKELRPWLDGARSPPLPRPTANAFLPFLEPSSKDLIQVRARFEAMQLAGGRHPYLEAERAISPAVLSDSRFEGRLRIDERRNAIFPHWNKDGLCGYEIKNRDFTGFAPGAEKGLWGSRIRPDDCALVIAETAIDALSHFALKRPILTRYVSTAGALNPSQPDLIRSAVQKLPQGAEIVLAVDNDAGGDQLADKIKALLGDLTGAGYVLIEDRPATPGDDWNDVLRASQGKIIEPVIPETPCP